MRIANSPLWGRRSRSDRWGSCRIGDRRSGHRPTTPPSVGFADTSPTGGGFVKTRLRPLTRKPAEGMGRRRSDPGHARNRVCRNTVSAWAGALRAAGGREPSDRGFLTRSDGGPRRAESWQTLRTARAISARAWCAASFGPEGEFPPSGPARPRPHPGPPRSADQAIRALRNRPTDTSRSTAPHRPSGRQLDGLPSGGAVLIMGAAWRVGISLGREFSGR
jgi:hypothetical protein